jgi:hypothetical protein
MAEKGIPLDQPLIGQVAAVEHSPTPLQAEAAQDLSAAPRGPRASTRDVPQLSQEVKDKALAYVDLQPDQAKQRMTPEERQTIKDIETLVLNADVPGLSAYIHKFAAQPQAAEKIMNTVVRDLASVGVWTTWNYSSTQPAPIPGWKGATSVPERIGNFNLSLGNQSAYIPGLRISTDGKATPFNTPSGVGSESSTLILKLIRDDWLQRTGSRRLESLR